MKSFKKSKIIALTGANGFTGRYICKELQKRKLSFKVIIRPGTNTNWMRQRNIDIEFADLMNKEELVKALKGAESLINATSLAFINIEILLNACKELDIKRAIFISSTSIFTSLNASSKSIRLNAENAIRSSNLDWTILRPTMIYGKIDDRNMIQLIRWIDKSPFLPIFGGGNHLQQPVHVEDVAWATVEVLNIVLTKKEIFNIAGQKALSFRKIIEIVARFSNKKILIINLPVRICIFFFDIFETLGFKLPIKSEQIKRLNENKDFSYKKATLIFNFKPRLFSEGISSEINDFQRFKKLIK